MAIDLRVVDKTPFGAQPASSNPIRLYCVRASQENPSELYFLGRIDRKNVPTICYFHGYSSAAGTLHLQDIHPSLHDHFNLIMPQDRAGYRRQGSAFIGGQVWQGSYLKILTALFHDLKRSHNISRVILGGASMGGFAALLYSVFLEADECYVACPQTSLNPKSWYYNIDDDFDRIAHPLTIKPWCYGYLKSIGISDSYAFNRISAVYPFVDLPNFIRLLYRQSKLTMTFSDKCSVHDELTVNLPKSYYHVTSCRYDHPKDYDSLYQREFIQPFISAMIDCGLHFSQLTLPFPGHDHYHSPTAIANYSNKYQDIISLRLTKYPDKRSSLPGRYTAASLYSDGRFANALGLLL